MTRHFVALAFLVLVAGNCGAALPRPFDLATWKLTLPVDAAAPGRPAEIRQPELASFLDDQHFFLNPTGDGLVFRAPCGGSTTKGSDYPRCELRETQPDGRSAAWGTNDGAVHTLTLEAAITATPPVKRHVVCAQIHDADDDVLMIRLEGQKLLIERGKGGGIVLDRGYVLGTKFSLKIEAEQGHVKVWHNGQQQLDWQVARRGCYFKAGCYTQSNVAQGDAPQAFGEVVIYHLAVEHRRVEARG